MNSAVEIALSCPGTDVEEQAAGSKPDEAYLSRIQDTIVRMSHNSFQCKTWGITLVSALLVVYLEQPNDMPHPECVYIAFAVLLLFGALDTYYLYLERGYRHLYNVAAGLESAPSGFRPRQMAILKEKRGLRPYCKALWSVTTGLFYGVVLVLLYLLVGFPTM